jgi:hypothetical protein
MHRLGWAGNPQPWSYHRRWDDKTYQRGHLPQGCRLDPRTVLLFLSAKVLRSGLRVAIQAVLSILAVMLITRILPERLSEVTFGQWTSGSGGDGVGRGLRIVVFGAPDIATAIEANNQEASKLLPKERSWTQYLCDEVSFFFFPPLGHFRSDD